MEKSSFHFKGIKVFTLKKEAAYFFEVLVHFYQTARQLNIEYSVQVVGFTFKRPFKNTKGIIFFMIKLLWLNKDRPT